MKKEDKSLVVKELARNIADYSHFYVVDVADMNSGKTSNLRRLCFNKEVKMLIVKNTLFIKALKESEGDYEELYDTLKGSSAVFFSNTGNDLPANTNCFSFSGAASIALMNLIPIIKDLLALVTPSANITCELSFSRSLCFSSKIT